MESSPKQRINDLSKINIPNELTPAAASFMAECFRLTSMDTFLLRTQMFVIDHLDQAIGYFVDDNKNNPLTKGFYGKEEIPEIFSSQFFLNTHKGLVEEIFLCRSVENFLKYLSDLLALVFSSRPETLRSNESEKLSYILNFTDMSALIEAIAEKKVEKLSYLGTQELFEYFKANLGFDLFAEEADREKISEAIEIRNVIVHNSGRVSGTFKKRVPSCCQDIGDRIAMPDASFSRVTLFNVAMAIDQSAVAKWGLPCINIKSSNGL